MSANVFVHVSNGHTGATFSFVPVCSSNRVIPHIWGHVIPSDVHFNSNRVRGGREVRIGIDQAPRGWAMWEVHEVMCFNGFFGNHVVTDVRATDKRIICDTSIDDMGQMVQCDWSGFVSWQPSVSVIWAKAKPVRFIEASRGTGIAHWASKFF